MESGLQTVKSTPILQNIPERAQVVSPTRLAKLPPIASLASDEHPSSTHLQAASSELKDAMKHLLSEVSRQHQNWWIVYMGVAWVITTIIYDQTVLLFADSFSYITHSYTFSVGCFTTCCIYRHNPQKIVFKEPWRHYGKEVSFLASLN